MKSWAEPRFHSQRRPERHRGRHKATFQPFQPTQRKPIRKQLAEIKPSGWATTGILVGAMGIAVGSAPIVFIGGAIVLVRLVAERWPRRVLDALVYERTIHPTKTVVGDEVEVRLSIWNRSRLPIAWASADEAISPKLRVTSAGGEVTIAGPMRPYEKVTRRLLLQPLARGVHEVGPVRIGVGEHFGTQHPHVDVPAIPATITARPLMVPVVGQSAHASSLAQLRARRSLYTDPTLFAGVRPFQTTDPLRSIHWRASAREGALQSKRYEPALSRQQVLVLDVQTLEGPYWVLGSDEGLFEDLCVAALSFARTLITADAACGFAAAGFSHTTQRFAFLPPRADRAQIERIGDVLARLTPESSAPLTNLLAWLPTRVTKGTTLAILSGRSPKSSAPVVKRLQSSGFPVQFVLFGVGASDDSFSDARRVGIPAWASRVNSEGGRPQSVTING